MVKKSQDFFFSNLFQAIIPLIFTKKLEKIKMELEKFIIRNFSEEEIIILLQNLTKFSKNLIDNQLFISFDLGFPFICYFFILFD